MSNSSTPLYAGEIIGEATTEAEAAAELADFERSQYRDHLEERRSFLATCSLDDYLAATATDDDVAYGQAVCERMTAWDEFFRLAAKSDRPMTGLDGDMMPIYATRDTRNAS